MRGAAAPMARVRGFAHRRARWQAEEERFQAPFFIPMGVAVVPCWLLPLAPAPPFPRASCLPAAAAAPLDGPLPRALLLEPLLPGVPWAFCGFSGWWW